MKKANMKLLTGTIVMVALLCLPILASADTVPWTTEQYMANAHYGSTTGTPVFGAPLPITDSYESQISWQNYSYSSVTDSRMVVNANSAYIDYHVWAEASFSGTYTASSAYPLFQFLYGGTLVNENPGHREEHYAWLTVTDLTTSTLLYDNQSLTLDGNQSTIRLETIDGHDISVNFGAKASAMKFLGPDTRATVTLDYNMAVAPEPISSILFVTGGTLLAGRRFLKRKKKA